MPDSEITLARSLVTANRILANEGILDVFGHISVRSRKNPDEYLLSCSRSPALVRLADMQRYRLDGARIGGNTQKPYIERIIHGAIYAARPDVQAVAHTHSDNVLPYAVSGEPILPVLHVGSLFFDGVPFFDSYDEGGNLLVSTASEGQALAGALGDSNAIVLRNHGCAVAGATLPLAVMAAIYLDVNARVQAAAARLGTVRVLERDEARRAAEVFLSSTVQQRAWEHWVSRLPRGWRRQAGLKESPDTGWTDSGRPD